MLLNISTLGTLGCLTNQLGYLLNAVAAKWINPHSNTPKSSGKHSQKSRGYYNRKGRLNLEWGVQKHQCDCQVVHKLLAIQCRTDPDYYIL